MKTKPEKVPTAPKRQRGIQSIEVGARLVFALLNSTQPLALRDLARIAGMPPAKAHKYLVSFGMIGLTRQEPASGAYDLGPLALQLGTAALHRLDFVREATLEAEQLARATRQTVFITLAGNMGPTVVRMEESGEPLHVNLRTGTVMSMVGTATGRVFAAFLPDSIVEKLLLNETGRMGGAAIGDERAEHEFRQAVEEVRRRGLARAVGLPIPGINAMSAPVFDANGKIVLAITAMGPAGTFDTSWNGPTARSLIECTRRVSARLGSI